MGGSLYEITGRRLATSSEEDMSGEVDISGLDKAELLAALHVKAFHPKHLMTGVLSMDDARKILSQGSYVDYAQGRVIKAELGQDVVDVRLFDRDAGKGTFARVVKELRAR